MRIYEEFTKAWETRDINSLAECFTPDWEFHMHSTGEIITLEQWKEFFGNMLNGKALDYIDFT